MTHQNLPDPSLNPDPANTQAKPTPKPPKRKRRWIRRIIVALGVVIVAIVLLAALTPTILSSGAARSYVIGKINQNLNGHVAVTNWSVGWTGGIKADDVKVFDAADRQILQIPRFSTELSLIGALRGNIHLGNTVVEGLDFCAQRDPDGTLNFARLLKPSREPHVQHEPREVEKPAKAATGDPAKLPNVDGEIRLVNCRGTFQDDQSHKTILFTTIAGDVKIPSINGTIENSLKIMAQNEGKEVANFGLDGKLRIAKDNVLLPAGQMNVEQKLTLTVDLSAAQPFLPANKDQPQIHSGMLAVNVSVNSDGQSVKINPLVNGKDIVLAKDGVLDKLDVATDGQLEVLATTTGGKPSTSIRLNNLRVMGMGSGLAFNGLIEDLENQRHFNNLTIDLTYNSAMIFNTILPLLSKETQASLKETKVAGNYTRKITLNGTLPADKAFNEAIAGLTTTGEFALDLLDSNGAKLEGLVLPFTLDAGKFRIAYPKGSAKEFAEPAHLNGGTFSLAGATIDLTRPVMTLSIPDGTKFLSNISVNPLFVSTYIGDDLNNPLFFGANKASGLLSIEFHHCDHVPLDVIVLQDSPANKGVIELNLKFQKLEIGNVLLAKISQGLGPLKSVINLAGGKLRMDSLSGDINDFNVLVQHGVSKQHLMLTVGGGQRGIKLGGTVILATKMMDMVMTIPMSTFGVKSKGADNDINIPISGPVNDPKPDTKQAVQDALKHIKGLPAIPGLGKLGQNDSSSTQPADAGTDILGNILKKKDKKKDKTDDQSK